MIQMKYHMKYVMKVNRKNLTSIQTSDMTVEKNIKEAV